MATTTGGSTSQGFGTKVLFLAGGALLLLLLLSVVPVLVASGGHPPGADTTGPAEPGTGVVPPDLVGPILAAGRTCPQLSPALLAAQLEQESGFDPGAYNPSSGAQGIAQFLPGTWDAREGPGKDPYDPDHAVPAAARYDCAIAGTVAHLDGDVTRLMLAGYNAGPGAVIQHAGVPPYPETLDYVTRILERVPAMQAALAGGLVGRAAGVHPAAAAAIDFARAQLGEPYVYGADGPDTWDCSSLVQQAYAAAGVELPRTTYAQAGESGPSVGLDAGDWRPGDLLFAAGPDGTPADPGHVGIYLGDGQVLHAPQTGDVVKTVPLDRYLVVTGVTRPADK